MTVAAARGFRPGDDLVWLPPDADAGAMPWPAIVFLHGIGERGGPGELDRVARWGLPRLRLAAAPPAGAPAFRFLVVAPQCPADRTWRDAAMLDRLEALLDGLVADGRTDPERLTVAGFSMGGIGAFALALRLPGRFAALVPVCGRCPEPDRLPELAHLPSWIAYAEDDEIAELAAGSRAAVAALAPFGRLESRPYRLGAADGVPAHVRACEKAFSDPALYAWLAARRRRGSAAAALAPGRGPA